MKTLTLIPYFFPLVFIILVILDSSQGFKCYQCYWGIVPKSYTSSTFFKNRTYTEACKNPGKDLLIECKDHFGWKRLKGINDTSTEDDEDQKFECITGIYSKGGIRLCFPLNPDHSPDDPEARIITICRKEGCNNYNKDNNNSGNSKNNSGRTFREISGELFTLALFHFVSFIFSNILPGKS